MSSIQHGTPHITCMFEHLSIHPMCLSPVQLKPMGILIGQKCCKSQLNHLELKSTRWTWCICIHFVLNYCLLTVWTLWE